MTRQRVALLRRRVRFLFAHSRDAVDDTIAEEAAKRGS